MGKLCFTIVKAVEKMKLKVLTRKDASLLGLLIVLVIADISIVYATFFNHHNEPVIMELHIEAIHIDSVYQKLLSYLTTNRNLLLVLITPVNYELMKAMWPMNLTKQQYTQVLTERYETLKPYSTKFSIHVHFADSAELMFQLYPYNLQLEMIREAKDFFISLGLPTTDFTPGWFTFNIATMKACQALNITNFHTSFSGTTYYHDYDLP
jgi:hypothetical protein